MTLWSSREVLKKFFKTTLKITKRFTKSSSHISIANQQISRKDRVKTVLYLKQAWLLKSQKKDREHHQLTVWAVHKKERKRALKFLMWFCRRNRKLKKSSLNELMSQNLLARLATSSLIARLKQRPDSEKEVTAMVVGQVINWKWQEVLASSKKKTRWRIGIRTHRALSMQVLSTLSSFDVLIKRFFNKLIIILFSRW